MAAFDKFRVVTIIPVYGEAGKIGNLILRFRGSSVDEVCLIVDCPSQTILDEIKRTSQNVDIPVTLFTNLNRKGIGYAIRRGIEYAVKRGFDAIVVMAGNGKDDPKEIPKLLKPIAEDGYDYVQGSRFLRGGKSVKNPILRGLFSRIYPFIWTFVTDIQCTDVTNGFRAYRTTIFDDGRINIWQDWLDGYALEYYVHFRVLAGGFRMKEVPVSKVYSHRHKGGYTKIHPFRDWWQIVGPLICLKLGARK